MNASLDEFRAAYTSAFDEYVAEPGEAALHAAYELGRDAVVRALGVLDLAGVHHDVLLAALRAAPGDLERITTAAADFFLESLSAFEMVQRGFRAAREAAAVEKRQASLLRQLSNFLADASLAATASESVEEMLQLVAEQARELVGGACSIASVTLEDGGPRRLEAISHSETDTAWSELSVRRLGEAYELVRPPRGVVRMTRRMLARHPAGACLVVAGRGVRGWLAAPLTALDGHELGVVHVFDRDGGDFSEMDEAVLVQLAQMAAGAFERVQLYTR